MEDRQILILLTIGELDVSQKCITDVSVDRNFSDVGDKFSITIVDSPENNVSYNLELYMAAGYRTMVLKYGDLSKNKLVAYNGVIWDYTNTFVGNMKKLTITGIMNRYTESTVGAANRAYNIDWNSYFNIRVNETQPYGAIRAIERNRDLNKAITMYSDGKQRTQISSAMLDSEFLTDLTYNSKHLTLKGANGDSVWLPIPDSFFDTTVLPSKLTPEKYENLKEDEYPEFYEMTHSDKYWGPLTITQSTREQANIDKLAITLSSTFYFDSVNQPNHPYYYPDADKSMDILKVPKDCFSHIAMISFTTDVIRKSLKYGLSCNERDLSYVKDHFYYVTWDIAKTLYMLPDKTNADDNNYKCRVTDAPYNINTFEEFINTIKLDHDTTTKKNDTSSGKRYYATRCFTADFFELAMMKGMDHTAQLKIESVTDSIGTTKIYLVDSISFDDKNRDALGFPIAFETTTKTGQKVGPFVLITDLGIECKHGEKLAAQMLHLDPDDPSKSHDYFHNRIDFTKNQEENINDQTNSLYFYQDNEVVPGTKFLRGFTIYNSDTKTTTFYLQANPEKTMYGSSHFVSSSAGVNIKDIVYKLARLEGWKVRESDIYPTEAVVNSDAFVMKNQTAMDFIIKNLVPNSVTPIGQYTLTNGKTEFITTPQGGFYPFFDEEGYFHYQPINENTIKDLSIDNLGYNIPNSPMLSFQINTKGTQFYTNNTIDYNPISLITGTNFENVTVASDAVINEVESVAYHNDTLDAWLGLTFEDAKKNIDTLTKFRNDDVVTAGSLSRLAQSALITPTDKLISTLNGSAEVDNESVRNKIHNAFIAIEDETIKATLSMWGDFEVAPARNITVNNMLKGGSWTNESSRPTKHPSSGKYLILSQQDKIDSNGFIQNLNLLRVTSEVKESIKGQKIDFTQPPTYVVNQIPITGGGGDFGGTGATGKF